LILAWTAAVVVDRSHRSPPTAARGALAKVEEEWLELEERREALVKGG